MKLSVFLAVLLSILGSTEVFAQYKVGDYYVSGDIKGIVFNVNNDEGTLAILKTDMYGRNEEYGIGDSSIPWADLGFIIQNANQGYPYTVWDTPTPRMARLIHENHMLLREKAIELGYRGLPREAFCKGRVGSDGVQRLIPVFYPRYASTDIFGTASAAYLIEYGCGVILYGIVDYTTGKMRNLEY